MKRLLSSLLLLGLLTAHARTQELAPLKIHMLGAGEYKPVESLTAFKKYLEEHYRVECSTSFGKDGKSLPNLDALKNADVMVVFLRRMNLPEEQMAIIRDHWEKGKPVVALRTASHGFQEADNRLFAGKVLGGEYKGPGSYTAPFKAISTEAQKEHPVLRGVGPIDSRGRYNFDKLAEAAIVLQVVDAPGKKVPSPVSWVHSYKGGRTFFSTMGVPEDFENETFRRLLTNAIFWTAQRDPDKLKLAK